MTPVDADRNAWTVSDLTAADYLGTLEVESTNHEGHPEIYSFEIARTHEQSSTPNRLVFGNPTNSGGLESGFLPMEEDETINAALHDLHDDIRTYYFDGPRFTSRIICNERM